MIFFPEKRMKEFFAYVLECVLTFNKMQNTSPLMCTKLEIWGQSILKVIQAFHTVRIFLYFGCSGPVVRGKFYLKSESINRDNISYV